MTQQIQGCEKQPDARMPSSQGSNLRGQLGPAQGGRGEDCGNLTRLMYLYASSFLIFAKEQLKLFQDKLT